MQAYNLNNIVPPAQRAIGLFVYFHFILFQNPMGTMGSNVGPFSFCYYMRNSFLFMAHWTIAFTVSVM